MWLSYKTRRNPLTSSLWNSWISCGPLKIWPGAQGPDFVLGETGGRCGMLGNNQSTHDGLRCCWAAVARLVAGTALGRQCARPEIGLFYGVENELLNVLELDPLPEDVEISSAAQGVGPGILNMCGLEIASVCDRTSHARRDPQRSIWPPSALITPELLGSSVALLCPHIFTGCSGRFLNDSGQACGSEWSGCV